MGTITRIGRHPTRCECSGCDFAARCTGRRLGARAPTSLKALSASTRVMRAGEHLYRPGDPFAGLLVVRSGGVKTYRIAEDGEEQVLGSHLPGEMLGFRAIAEGVHSSAAVALDTSSVCTLDWTGLVRECRRDPALHEELLRWVSEAIVTEDRLAHLLARKSADQRMALFLLDYARRLARWGLRDDRLRLAMSRTDIANHLGLAVETVSRVLTRFQEAGGMEVDRQQVDIVRPEQLHAIAEAARSASAPLRAAAG